MKRYQTIELKTKKEALKRIAFYKEAIPCRSNFKIEKTINNTYIVSFSSTEIF